MLRHDSTRHRSELHFDAATDVCVHFGPSAAGLQRLHLLHNAKRTLCGGPRRVRTEHFQNNIGLPAIMAVVVGMVSFAFLLSCVLYG